MGFSEDRSIESPALKIFDELNYRLENLYSEQFGPDNPRGRETSSDVVLTTILKKQLCELNPEYSEDSILSAIHEIIRDRSSLSAVRANQEVYELLKNGVKVQIKNENGQHITKTVNVIDWIHPEKNNFFLASQMWISGELHSRRPDLIGFVNGIPLIIFELKKFTVNVKHAFDDNLSDYRDTIPQLFWYNAFVILSNGRETKIGSFSAPWEHFNEWKKINEEGEEGKVSLETLIRGTCEKNRFIDLLENFILFSDVQGKLIKILGKNHQYLGVNKALHAFLKTREEKEGKIGVFWHTTGSGKSYSMIFFSNKILRKISAKFTFLIVTDRVDLDDQIYKNFEKSGAVTEPHIRARNSSHLRKLLKEDHRHIFTLIHKFQFKQKTDSSGKTITVETKFPQLSDRDDIIVICDEAHRTQYGQLAANMRDALPKATFIAFTATPLFVEDQKTRQIFGDYVSIYNFKQSIEDGATVPLYYIKGPPEVEVINKELDTQIEKLIEEANLDEDQIEKLRRKYPSEFNIITNDSRLELVAKHIVDHYMGRGYRGKAMVVSVDRFTAVKMYDKVKFYWSQRIQELEAKLTRTSDYERQIIERDLKYMKETDMAVVISNSQNEIKKFKEKGLAIRPHRKRIISEDLDVKFKDEDNPLRIVFVCAMWMTGFDAPPVSTIYLDKPIKNHTLMQTISRANRVFKDKQSGMIVDYYGVLRNLKEALAIYGSGSGGGIVEGDIPLRYIDELEQKVKSNLELMNRYFTDRGFIPKTILEASDFDQLRLIDEAVEIILTNDESKILFFSLLRMIANSYADLLPDPKANSYRMMVSLYVHIGETIAAEIPDIDISDVEGKIEYLIDRSIGVKPTIAWDSTKVIDLSKIDLKQIRISFEKGRKTTEAEKLRSLVNQKLAELLRKNKYRIDFQERLEKLVDSYNNGSLNLDQYFVELTKFLGSLQEEEKRHIKENLTEEELAVVDILTKPEPKLTKNQETQVKKIAHELLETLKEQKLVIDWKKKVRTRADVELTIEDILWEGLPKPPYPDKIKQEKIHEVYQHIYDSYFGAGLSTYSQK